MATIAEKAMKPQVATVFRVLARTSESALRPGSVVSSRTIGRRPGTAAASVVAEDWIAYSPSMFRVPQDKTQRRRANIEAACRIAMRMAKSGRGRDAGLAFLQAVTTRELGRVAIIVAQAGERETTLRGADAVTPAPYWVTSIRATSGKLLGELRVIAAEPDGPDDADVELLVSVARTAARIMAPTAG